MAMMDDLLMVVLHQSIGRVSTREFQIHSLSLSSFSNSVSRNKGEDNEAKDGEVVPEDIGNFYEQLDKDLDEKEDRKKNTNVWQFEIEQDKVDWTP